MEIQPLDIVTGGHQMETLGMTGGATERRVYLFNPDVADQTVGHLRKRGIRHGVRFRKSAMAGFACVLRTKQTPQVAGRRQVLFRTDCGRNHRRDIAHPQMLPMVELR